MNHSPQDILDFVNAVDFIFTGAIFLIVYFSFEKFLREVAKLRR